MANNSDKDAAAKADDGKNNPQNNPQNKPKNGRKRRIALIVLTLLFLTVGVAYTLMYLFVLRWRETTDDAYVGGNQVAITAQVSGTVVAILADETQLVQAGQAVVKLDPTDADVALEQGRTALAQAVRATREQFAQAKLSGAQLDQRRLELDRARADYNRRVPLLAEHAIPAEEVQHAKDALATAEAAMRAAEGQVAAAQAPIVGVDIAHNPSVLQARAKFREAYLAAQRNTIPSPVTGYVARRNVQVGQRVAPGGNPLLAIVPMDQLWVDANFKEAELRNIRIGQPVEVTTDIYGGAVEYHGRVVGLGAGTGSAFSLLPAQNASGNWIKVVQRVPVRIAFDRNDLAKHPLRIGLSTYV
ncbi:MAG TPA: HlyD family efflux transporter periplasmic adaptor subunit, partial [Rudaea sp.]